MTGSASKYRYYNSTGLQRFEYVAKKLPNQDAGHNIERPVGYKRLQSVKLHIAAFPAKRSVEHRFSISTLATSVKGKSGLDCPAMLFAKIIT